MKLFRAISWHVITIISDCMSHYRPRLLSFKRTVWNPVHAVLSTGVQNNFSSFRVQHMYTHQQQCNEGKVSFDRWLTHLRRTQTELYRAEPWSLLRNVDAKSNGAGKINCSQLFTYATTSRPAPWPTKLSEPSILKCFPTRVKRPSAWSRPLAITYCLR